MSSTSFPPHPPTTFAIDPALAAYVRLGQDTLTIAPSRGRTLTSRLGLLFFLLAGSAPFVAFAAGASEPMIAQSFGAAMTLVFVVVIYLHQRFWSSLVTIDARKRVLMSVERRSHDIYPLAELRLVEREGSGTLKFILFNQRTDQPVGSLRLVGRKELATADALRTLLGQWLAAATPGQTAAAAPAVQGPRLLLTIVVTLGIFFALIAFSVGGSMLFSCATGTGLSGFLFGLAVLFTLLVLQTLRMQWQSVSWPSVQGVVLERGRSAPSNSSSTEHITFRYTVAGEEHTGRSNEPDPDSVPGQPITVYHHPSKPDRTVLRTGVRGSTWFLAFVFTALTVAAAIWMRSEWQGFDLHRVVEALREF